MQFLTQKTKDYLGKLFLHEMRNAYIYSYVSSYLATIGLEHFAEFFKLRSHEEFKHSEWVREFCEEKNILLDFGSPIEGFDYDLSLQPISAFTQLAYDVEMETNKLWDLFFKMVYEEGNSPLLITLAIKFQDEQNEETKWATDLIDYAENLGDDKSQWQRFDTSFDPHKYDA